MRVVEFPKILDHTELEQVTPTRIFNALRDAEQLDVFGYAFAHEMGHLDHGINPRDPYLYLPNTLDDININLHVANKDPGFGAEMSDWYRSTTFATEKVDDLAKRPLHIQFAESLAALATLSDTSSHRKISRTRIQNYLSTIGFDGISDTVVGVLVDTLASGGDGGDINALYALGEYGGNWRVREWVQDRVASRGFKDLRSDDVRRENEKYGFSENLAHIVRLKDWNVRDHSKRRRITGLGKQALIDFSNTFACEHNNSFSMTIGLEPPSPKFLETIAILTLLKEPKRAGQGPSIQQTARRVAYTVALKQRTIRGHHLVGATT